MISGHGRLCLYVWLAVALTSPVELVAHAIPHRYLRESVRQRAREARRRAAREAIRANSSPQIASGSPAVIAGPTLTTALEFYPVRSVSTHRISTPGEIIYKARNAAAPGGQRLRASAGSRPAA